MNQQQQKKEVRNQIQKKISQLPFHKLIEKSDNLVRGFHDLLIGTSKFDDFIPKTIVSFYPFGNEPQINIESEMRNEPYTVSYVRIESWNERKMLPRESRRDQPGDWEEFDLPGGQKIFQPAEAKRIIAPNEVSAILVPGVAFSTQGVRIGRGAGFYDRFLKEYPQALRVGIAFQEQVLEDLPSESWDESVDVILTDQGLIPSISMKLFGGWKTQGKLVSRHGD